MAGRRRFGEGGLVPPVATIQSKSTAVWWTGMKENGGPIRTAVVASFIDGIAPRWRYGRLGQSMVGVLPPETVPTIAPVTCVNWSLAWAKMPVPVKLPSNSEQAMFGSRLSPRIWSMLCLPTNASPAIRTWRRSTNAIWPMSIATVPPPISMTSNGPSLSACDGEMKLPVR